MPGIQSLLARFGFADGNALQYLQEHIDRNVTGAMADDITVLRQEPVVGQPANLEHVRQRLLAIRVDLYGNKLLGQHAHHRGILKRLLLHGVAICAPVRPEVNEHLFPLGFSESHTLLKRVPFQRL